MVNFTYTKFSPYNKIRELQAFSLRICHNFLLSIITLGNKIYSFVIFIYKEIFSVFADYCRNFSIYVVFLKCDMRFFITLNWRMKGDEYGKNRRNH